MSVNETPFPLSERERLIKLESLFEQLNGRLDRLCKRLDGNGQPGVLEKMRHESLKEVHLLREQMEEMNVTISDKMEALNKALVKIMVVIAGSAGTAGGLGGYLIKTLVGGG